MKNLKIILIKSVACSLLITALFGLLSCGNSAENRKASASGVEPPEVDIHTAVVTGNIEAVKQHIQAGTDLNEPDPFGGSSPLISASVFGKPEIAKVLIDAGADINFQNKEGSTPLITAAFFCRPEIVQMLLDAGADKSIKNKYDATAYESVTAPYSEVKSAYEMMENALGPMGLKLDHDYIQKTRPEIAEMLK